MEAKEEAKSQPSRRAKSQIPDRCPKCRGRYIEASANGTWHCLECGACQDSDE